MGTKGFGITVPHLWRIQWPLSGICPLPRLAAEAVAPRVFVVGWFHLCMAVLCVGKDFKKQLTK